jgi:hypothetical protein
MARPLTDGDTGGATACAGEIFSAHDTTTGTIVALKVCKTNDHLKMLKHEATVLKDLAGTDGGRGGALCRGVIRDATPQASRA